jgi:multidrug transporter EmrE-like cation transporter
MFLIIVLEVFLNVAAQLSLKMGTDKIGHFEVTWNNLGSAGLQILFSPWLWLGLFIYVLSVVVWLFVLSRVEVSLAYPLLSVGYLLNAIAAYYFFNEHVTILRIFGIFFILVGVFLMARS